MTKNTSLTKSLTNIHTTKFHTILRVLIDIKYPSEMVYNVLQIAIFLPQCLITFKTAYSHKTLGRDNKRFIWK